MTNYVAEFDPIAILGLVKRPKGSDFANGPNRSPESISNCLDVFVNILKYMMDQQLIFDLLVLLNLLNMINGSNHNYGTHKKTNDCELKFLACKYCNFLLAWILVDPNQVRLVVIFCWQWAPMITKIMQASYNVKINKNSQNQLKLKLEWSKQIFHQNCTNTFLVDAFETQQN